MKRPWAIYPFLFSGFSVLTLFANNLTQYQLGATFGVLTQLLCGTLVGLAVVSVVFRNVRKGAILITIFLFFFLLYGHLNALLPEWKFYIGQRLIHQGHTMVLFATVVWLFTAYRLFKTRNDLAKITAILNFTAFVLVVVPLFKIIVYEIKTNQVGHIKNGDEESAVASNDRFTDRLPHIFYIILDGYGREDLLKEIYNYDNSEFLNFLKSRGFYVAHQSRSNYSHTSLSLASSLNMEYLNRLSAQLPEEYTHQMPVANMIRHSNARDLLKNRGYSFATISSGFSITEIKDADIYVNETNPYNEFELGFWNLTALRKFLKKDEIDRDRILQGFDVLPKLAQSNKPLFVFAHILAPHPPFLFGRDGKPSGIKNFYAASANHIIKENYLTRTEYMRYYIDQLDFVNRKITGAVSGILSDAEVNPIIIIQSDHGPGSFLCHESMEDTYLKDRMSILNAYHFPQDGNELLYRSITPVNSFRVLFSHLFRLDYPLLSDRSYFSQIKRPYQFRDVTDEIGGPEDSLRYERLKLTEYTRNPLCQ